MSALDTVPSPPLHVSRPAAARPVSLGTRNHSPPQILDCSEPRSSWSPGPDPPGAPAVTPGRQAPRGPSGVLRAIGRAAPPVLAGRPRAEPEAEAVRDPGEATAPSDPPGLQAGTGGSSRAGCRRPLCLSGAGPGPDERMKPPRGELPLRAWLGRPRAGRRARPGCTEKAGGAISGAAWQRAAPGGGAAGVLHA